MDKLNDRKPAISLYVFLLVFVIAWGLCQFLRHQIGIDAMEAICWGELLDFGTNKHPPLSGWVMAGFFNLFGQNDHVAYFLGAACIGFGMLFIYKLAKFFISEEKAVCAAIIMSVNFYYTFTLFDDNFNCNELSMMLWPMVAYFYYKSVRLNKVKDWILFGITLGLGALAKYQIIFLFIALFIHFLIYERKHFKSKGFYLSIFSGILVILPHIVWLIKNDFFSFTYMTSQAAIGENSSPLAIFSFKRIFSPIKFIADQILSVLPCAAIYFIVAMKEKSLSINKDYKNSDSAFLLFICIIPALIQGLMGTFTGSHIHGSWGSIMVSFVGIMLFYFFPIKFKEDTFLFFKKFIYFVFTGWVIAMAVFSQLQLKLAISYPYEANIKAFHTIWSERTNNAPLKYVSGDIDHIFQFRVYDKSRPHVILDTFGYKNPWENHDDILKSGALIFADEPNNIESIVRDRMIYLPEDYKITPELYEYEIKNRFGKRKVFQIYYAVIPPQN